MEKRSYINLGTCNSHVIHNSFLSALEEYGTKISDFIIDIYYFFNNWPTRKSAFEKIQEKNRLPKRSFLKHVSSRWLNIGPAAKRVIDQWPALVEYFLNDVPENNKHLVKTDRYIRIKKMIENFITKEIDIVLFKKRYVFFHGFLIKLF